MYIYVHTHTQIFTHLRWRPRALFLIVKHEFNDKQDKQNNTYFKMYNKEKSITHFEGRTEISTYFKSQICAPGVGTVRYTLATPLPQYKLHFFSVNKFNN